MARRSYENWSTDSKGARRVAILARTHTRGCNSTNICSFTKGRDQAHWLTPWSRVLLEKPTSAHLVKIFPTFYRTRRFFTVFTRARHWPLPWFTCNAVYAFLPIPL